MHGEAASAKGGSIAIQPGIRERGFPALGQWAAATKSLIAHPGRARQNGPSNRYQEPKS